MTSVRTKIRNIFILLFLGAWMISAFHLGKIHWQKGNNPDLTITEMVLEKPQSTGKGYSEFLSAIVGALHYMYAR